ncbi:MAG: ParA family protein [Thermodesulfobacteriota bacterium]
MAPMESPGIGGRCRMSATIISFVNLKGGVGKTALTVNVGVSLAAQLGKRVLVIDLDPQCNASLWLMGEKAWVKRVKNKHAKTTYGLVCRHEPVGECIVHSPVENSEGIVEAGTLDLIPASFHLMTLEEEYHHKEGTEQPYVRFYQQIKILRGLYDFIFLDCAPNVYRATKCALFASDIIVAPCSPDALSWLGLNLLASQIRKFGRATANEFAREREGQDLSLLGGIIINDVHSGYKNINKYTRDRFVDRLSRLKQAGFATEDAQVFPTEVSHAPSAFQKDLFQFIPLLLSQPEDAKILKDYEKVAKTFFAMGS